MYEIEMITHLAFKMFSVGQDEGSITLELGIKPKGAKIAVAKLAQKVGLIANLELKPAREFVIDVSFHKNSYLIYASELIERGSKPLENKHERLELTSSETLDEAKQLVRKLIRSFARGPELYIIDLSYCKDDFSQRFTPNRETLASRECACSILRFDSELYQFGKIALERGLGYQSIEYETKKHWIWIHPVQDEEEPRRNVFISLFYNSDSIEIEIEHVVDGSTTIQNLEAINRQDACHKIALNLVEEYAYLWLGARASVKFHPNIGE